jgi:hypothetical protein
MLANGVALVLFSSLSFLSEGSVSLHEFSAALAVVFAFTPIIPFSVAPQPNPQALGDGLPCEE